jgi:uncharacterized protein RhaS with RHS repeats
MKKFTAFICLLFSVSIFAQYTPQEIKKYKIAKIIKFSANKDASETQKQEKLYDRYGNDTATYLDGQLYMRSVYEYNEKGQPAKSITYNFSGGENETAVYDYKADRSFSISNTDKQFGMTDYTYYDKAGRVTKTKMPDGSERIYTYDPQGRLMKLKSKPGDDGVLVDIQYTYNSKGQLIKETSKGEYKWTTTNTYDAKGLLIKSVTASSQDGVVTKSTNTYKYEFWK